MPGKNKKETNNLVISLCQRLEAVIVNKAYATKYQVLFSFIYFKAICFCFFVQVKVSCSKLAHLDVKYHKLNAAYTVYIQMKNVASDYLQKLLSSQKPICV